MTARPTDQATFYQTGGRDASARRRISTTPTGRPQRRREVPAPDALAPTGRLDVTGRSEKRGRNLPPPRVGYSITSLTTPEPTVLPPSRIANRLPASNAIGRSSSTSNRALSPGITISTPVGKPTRPVTSVVRT